MAMSLNTSLRLFCRKDSSIPFSFYPLGGLNGPLEVKYLRAAPSPWWELYMCLSIGRRGHLSFLVDQERLGLEQRLENK